MPIGRLQAVVGTLAANQRGPDGVCLVVGWRCRAGQIIDLVEARHPALERLNDVMLDQMETSTGPEAKHVLSPSGGEIVYADDIVAFFD